MGYADCNHNTADGCETPLNTPTNCGGCGHVCQQVGGTNACVLSGTNYVCKPTCDATHADCNHMPDDGCEVDLTGPNNCGACGHACTNPHGTTTCTTQGDGWFCNPTCTRAVRRLRCRQDGRLHHQHRQRRHRQLRRLRARLLDGGHDRRPSCIGRRCARRRCAAPYSDCSDPAAPGADNGCETNGTIDPARATTPATARR